MGSCLRTMSVISMTMDDAVAWFKQITHQSIDAHKFKYDGAQGTYIDIIKNVINLVATHWAADWLVSVT